MAAYQQTGRAPGLKNTSISSDWAIHGNPTLDTFHDGDFDADIDTLVEDQSASDSGYFSGHGAESKPLNSDLNRDTFECVKEFETISKALARLEASIFVQVNHGSADGFVQQQDTAATKSAKHTEANRSSSNHSEHLEYEGSICPKYANLNHKITSLSPLESWVRTYERHESIAVQQPLAKKRRSTIARQQ